ncbi:PAB1 binding protein, partial [Coemansia spiralis]
GYPSHYGSGNDSYRGTGQPGGMRPAAPAAMSYAGYAMPTAMYPAYAAQGAVGGTHGGHYGGNYGGNMASMTGASSVGAYGSAYGAAAAQYQFATPAAYGYATAPMQGMYGSRAGNPAAAYTPRAYGGYGASPQMPQQSPSGGAGGSVDAMGQTVQQIYVPSDRIGAVIGRRGETINEIRRVTCARVDIKDSAPGAQERLVVITGQYEQVHTAYGMIKDKAYSAQQSTRPDMGHM